MMLRPIARCGLATVLVAACGNDEALPADARPVADAPATSADARPDAFTGPDGDQDTCFSPADTADAMTTGGGPNEAYDRLYAGGIYDTGPVAPPALGPGTEPAFALRVVFSPDPSYPPFNDCDPSVDCAVVGLTGNLGEVITPETAVGAHPVALHKTDDVEFTVDATITIDAYESPYGDGIGSMAGSITGTTAGRTVTGTFDGRFCGAMISYTI